MDNISLSQKQIILGGLLGDASFYKEKKYISFSQSEKQLNYIKWKYSMFYNDEKHLHSVYNTWNNQRYLRYYFYYYLNSNNALYSFINKNLYSNEGRKKISLKYLNELTPLGLAIWWMDDGCMCLSKRNRYGKLSTHCFNYEEHILLQKYFKEKWNINVAIKQEKECYFLRFNVEDLKKLIKIIYPYVTQVDGMSYKIDLNYKYEKCIEDDFKDIYYYIKKYM